jgi:sugar lactone lactonase YvrE
VQSSAVAGGGIGAAVDRNGLVFSITADGTGVSTFNDNGTLANTTSGVLTGASALAIDGGDQLWIASPGSVSVGQILGSGQASIADPTLQKPSGIAIDLSGNVWISDSQSNTVHEIVGGGMPTQPLATAVTNKTPGTEPQ